MRIINLVCLAFVTWFAVACTGSAQFLAPQQVYDSYGKRVILSCSQHGQITIQESYYGCDNKYGFVKAVTSSSGAIELRNHNGVKVFSKSVESSCSMLEPPDVRQCGFVDGVPVGSSVVLLFVFDLQSIKLTLTIVDHNRVQLDVQGATDDKSFSKIFPYPLTEESRTYLASTGVPKSLIAGLR